MDPPLLSGKLQKRRGYCCVFNGEIQTIQWVPLPRSCINPVTLFNIKTYHPRRYKPE